MAGYCRHRSQRVKASQHPATGLACFARPVIPNYANTQLGENITSWIAWRGPCITVMTQQNQLLGTKPPPAGPLLEPVMQ